MADLTREALIALCEAASRPESAWHDRDSEQAQRQVGELWVLLRAGCAFEVDRDFAPSTNDKTLWVRTLSKGFNYFEMGEMREDHFYLPTRARLDSVGEKDWY